MGVLLRNEASGSGDPSPLGSTSVRGHLSSLFVVLAGLAVPTVAVAEESSNPAFLGVGMHDAASSSMTSVGPCVIDSITADSGAADAGMRPDDIVTALDATPIPNCDALVKTIQAKEPGQPVKIEIRRNGVARTLSTALPSRADVLRKRFVGKPAPLTTLLRIDDRSGANLSTMGKTTVIGWFDQSQCVSCASTFSAINDWVRAKGSKTNISVMGVTQMPRYEDTAVESLKKVQRQMDAPLMLTDTETFKELSINDVKRIHFMVIDCRGIVSYVTPLKPDADDRPAILEELYAATEQAARRAK